MLWILLHLFDIGVFDITPMRLYCDNKVAINLANNHIQHERKKNEEINRHFIREKIDKGTCACHTFSLESKLLISSQNVFPKLPWDMLLARYTQFEEKSKSVKNKSLLDLGG